MTDLHDLRGWPRTIAGAWWTVSFGKTASTRTHHEGREVIITASSWLAAQRALNLIVASLRVLAGEPILFEADERLVAWNDLEPEVGDREVFNAQRGQMKTEGIAAACCAAVKASRRRAWQYAVTKFRFSLKLYGLYAADLDPFRSRQHFALSRFADDHVMFGYAIMAAYSAIEDLGLELRASRENPSRINGAWNPVVKQELEARLRAAGVSLDETLLWTIRGSDTSIQRRRPVPVASRARWAGGLVVRDGQVELVDAIAYADWLRDKIAAHGVNKELTPSLSPYDVVNVQHVARRLIMEVLCGWRRCFKPPTALTRERHRRVALRATGAAQR